MTFIPKRLTVFLAVFAFPVAVLVAACGGNGGDGGTSSGASITSYFVDAPTKGLSYACSPSGLSGLTSSTGSFTCQTGDTVSFSLGVGAATIHLGSVAVPGISGVSIPVTMLPNGLQIAAVLHALNHGSSANIDVSGLTIPAADAALITAYIASGGSLPAGQNSDDQFLAYLQSRTTAGAPFANRVNGTGKSFQQDMVLPHLQNTIHAIGMTNPRMPRMGNMSKLSGTMLVTGSGTVPAAAGCTSVAWQASGGGILNAMVSGDIQNAGTYPVTFSSPGFLTTISISPFSCTAGGSTTTYPATTSTSTVPPFSGTDTVTVTPALGGNSLSLGQSSTPPSGCVGGNVSGTDVGLSNPLITLSTSVTCTVQGASATVSVTAKLVGAW